MKIVADDKIPFLKGVLEPFSSVKYLPGNLITKDHITDADAIITRSITNCNSELLKDTKVKFIATATIGDDHIDKTFCTKNNIQWTSAKGCNSGAVEQYVLSAILNLAIDNAFDISGLTIGIIGVGNIGSKIKRIAEILDLKILLNDPPRAEAEEDNEFVGLDQVLSDSDIISLHVPLIFEGKFKTYHLADETFFDQLEKEKIFINSSRGGVVNTKALIKAIDNQKILHSVIDVWEDEPNIHPELLGWLDYGTPHIAGYSWEGKAMGTAMSVSAISRFFNLGIDDWYPEIEKPEHNLVSINCEGKTIYEIIREAVNATYDIRKDSHQFKGIYNEFENLRRNYSFRWEYDNYNIELKNVTNNSNLSKKLVALGFKIV